MDLLEKKSLYAKEQDRDDVKQARVEFKNFMSELDVNKLIVIDESGFKLNMVLEYARGLKGERVKMPAPVHGENISVIGAMGINGVIEIGMVQGSVKAPCVETFIEKILLPKLKYGDILVIDNAPVHNMNRIKAILKSIGAKVLPLPKYSPDLSPIEPLWSKLKGIIKKLAPRTLLELYEALDISLDCIDSDDASGWFEHCGYSV